MRIYLFIFHLYFCYFLPLDTEPRDEILVLQMPAGVLLLAKGNLTTDSTHFFKKYCILLCSCPLLHVRVIFFFFLFCLKSLQERLHFKTFNLKNILCRQFRLQALCISPIGVTFRQHLLDLPYCFFSRQGVTRNSCLFV